MSRNIPEPFVWEDYRIFRTAGFLVFYPVVTFHFCFVCALPVLNSFPFSLYVLQISIVTIV